MPSADLWWLLADGRLIQETASIPDTDPFSWSAPGAPWHNDQWLCGWLAFSAYQLWGLGGLHCLKALILSATWGLLLDTGRRLQTPCSRLGCCVALGICLFSASGARFFDVRAYLFTYLFLALLWRWLQLQPSLHRGKLALLFCVWANLHGGVSSGLLLLGLEMLLSPPPRRRHLAQALGLAALCSCLNPSGIWILLHPIRLLGSPWGRYLNEWQPAWRKPELFWPLFLHLGLWVLALGAQRHSRRWSWQPHDAVLALMGLFCLSGWRHIPLFALLSLPRWCRVFSSLDRGPSWKVWPVWLALLLWAGLRPLRLADPTQSGEAEFFPRQASDFLQSQPQSPKLFHPYGLGGYLLWRFPRGPYRVCIDGRALQVYPWSCYEEYLKAIYNAEQFQRYCDRNQIETAMLFSNPRRLDSLRLIEGQKNWALIYQDPLVSIVSRKLTEGARSSPPP